MRQSWIPYILFGFCSLSFAADLRIGMIGLDTSHSTAFTKVLNDESAPNHIPGARVVAAYRDVSPDIEESRNRIDRYVKELQEKYHVEMVPDIETLCRKVDVVMIESVDGRKHLAQAKAAIAAHKPVWIDKPLASTLADAREIDRLAKQAGVPWFSASALRYSPIVETMKRLDAGGAITWGPGPLEEHHQLSLSWYAIHPIEILYSLLGPGCEEVTEVSTANADEVTCKWKDGKLGTARALRPYSEYGAVVFGPKQEVTISPAKTPVDYVPLVRKIIEFFQTGKPPVPNEETLEMFAFMDAAQRSKDAGGKPMRLR